MTDRHSTSRARKVEIVFSLEDQAGEEFHHRFYTDRIQYLFIL